MLLVLPSTFILKFGVTFYRFILNLQISSVVKSFITSQEHFTAHKQEPTELLKNKVLFNIQAIFDPKLQKKKFKAVFINGTLVLKCCEEALS